MVNSTFSTSDILTPDSQQLRGVADWGSAVPRGESLILCLKYRSKAVMSMTVSPALQTNNQYRIV